MPRFHRVRRIVGIVLSCCVIAAAGRCAADVRLPRIFGNQMVLQRGLPVRVWGTAAPGEKVTVSIGKNESAATAAANGKWSVELPPPEGGPLEVTVQGKNKITLRDVLVGEVWVCSGQSNMQFSVRSTNIAKQEIAAARHPHIRLFTVPMRPAGEPADDIDQGYWTECKPETVPDFSAVAYFFGRDLHKQLGVPIGLINTSWGGTRIEPWTPVPGFRSVPALASVVSQIEKLNAEYPQTTVKAVEKFAKWLPIAEKAKAAGKPIPAPPEWPKHPLDSNNMPTGLYNGMIHPLVPFAIRGAIWYQGESNAGEGMLYYEKMKALINGWRTVWNEGEFPFLFVQLAPFNYGNPTTLPRLWEAQTATLAVPDTGMAATQDIGNPTDIHPQGKQDVGNRLALWALAKAYGKAIVYSGPMYKAMSIDGSTIRLKFKDVGGGLVSRDGKPLSWFEVAGEDKKFVPADAKIDVDSVVVSSPRVAKPVAVRFAWNGVADPNLANMEGLPAVAFRTDRW